MSLSEKVADVLRERVIAAICDELKQKHDANIWEHDGKTWATVGWDGPYMSESSGEIDIDAGALADAVVAALGLTEEFTWSWPNGSAKGVPGFGFSVPTRAEAEAEGGEYTIVHRHVTGWTPSPQESI